jgi:hypothetical protein
VKEAFNNRPFLYHGESVLGFCGLCNQERQVTLRLFFACAPCATMISSYQKSFVAASAVHDVWERVISPRNPHLKLAETEVVQLEPYARKSRTKLAASKTLDTLDFLVSEEGQPRFHIELKSGPLSVLTMNEFQLDVNDFNDIIGASCHTGLPTYILHVELMLRYAAPTRRVIAGSVWWTDFRRLRNNLTAVRKRRGEDKDAAYFRREAFESIDTFAAEIQYRGFEALHHNLDLVELALPARGYRLARAKVPRRARK